MRTSWSYDMSMHCSSLIQAIHSSAECKSQLLSNQKSKGEKRNLPKKSVVVVHSFKNSPNLLREESAC